VGGLIEQRLNLPRSGNIGWSFARFGATCSWLARRFERRWKTVNGPEVAAVGQEIKVDGVGGFQALQRMRDAGCGWKYIATRGRRIQQVE
jgi:hypothetical protein